MDGQLVEIVNTHKVIAAAIAAGLEVARPERDDGIDLIIYSRKGGPWVSAPIQIKSRFCIERKYESRPALVMCYVCPSDQIYVLTHEQAKEIAEARGYTNTTSWKKKGGGYSCPVGGALAKDLEPFIATPERWAELLVGEKKPGD
jgi:hypothetical protein